MPAAPQPPGRWQPAGRLPVSQRPQQPEDATPATTTPWMVIGAGVIVALIAVVAFLALRGG